MDIVCHISILSTHPIIHFVGALVLDSTLCWIGRSPLLTEVYLYSVLYLEMKLMERVCGKKCSLHTGSNDPSLMIFDGDSSCRSASHRISFTLLWLILDNGLADAALNPLYFRPVSLVLHLG